MVTADVNTITYFCDLTRRMRSTVRVRAFGAQDVGPFTAVITEVPRTYPLSTACHSPTEAISVVALGTAGLVAQEKFSAITADVAVVFMNLSMHYCLMSVRVEVGYMSKAGRYSEEKCP